MAIRIVLLACAAALLAACGAAVGDLANGAAAQAAGVAADNLASTSAAAAEPGPPMQVMVYGHGVACCFPGSHNSRTFEFGRPRAEVLAFVASLRGRPSATGAESRCRAGRIDYVDFGNLRLNFQGERFVGWDAAPGEPVVQNEWGFRIGTNRADYWPRDARLALTRTAGGFEHVIDDDLSPGLHVLFSDDGPDATVLDIWAGMVCRPDGVS